jgi:hypothetical protein
MDPVSALSVAASVIQFVDYGTRVISKARELYTSADGALSANSKIEEATTRLQALSGSLKADEGLQIAPLDETDTALDKICKECSEVSQELVEMMEKLKLPKSCKNKKWESFRRTLKGVWEKEKTKEVVDRLARLRSELDTHVLVSIR